MGGSKKEVYKVTLPGGGQTRMHNGDRGFLKRNPTTLRIWSSWRCLPGCGITLTDKLAIGKKSNMFPADQDVSKHHLTAACMNNYYFLKDAGSKHGTYIKLSKGGSGPNGKIELHKGMTFAVGKLHFKVSDIQGDAADNKAARAARDAAKAAAEAKAAEAKPEELDSDEEFADDDDDDGPGGTTTKLDGPPVMFLSSVDKKLQIRGRIRETSTIGTGASNKIVIKPEVAKPRSVEDVQTKIVLEDGHFYLTDASKGSIGTSVGLPRKKFFEVNPGDKLLLGKCTCAIDLLRFPIVLRPLDGIIDHLMGADQLNVYDMKISGSSPIETRLKAAMNKEEEKKAAAKPAATDGNNSD